MRQTFELEVGEVSEMITVVESTPLVQAGSAAQLESLGAKQRELPVARRNLQNLVGLSPGVSLGDSSGATGRSFRINGAGDGSTSITVDGSSATANGENHGFGQYGGANQIELMSLEAVAEIQVVKGVQPAEYGGAVGGQVARGTDHPEPRDVLCDVRGVSRRGGDHRARYRPDAANPRPGRPARTGQVGVRFIF